GLRRMRTYPVDWVPLFTQLPSKTGVFEVVAVTTMSLSATSCGLPDLTLIPVFLLILSQKSSHLFGSREFTTTPSNLRTSEIARRWVSPWTPEPKIPSVDASSRAMYFVATALAAAVLTAVT